MGWGGLSMGGWGNMGVGGRVSPKGHFCVPLLLQAARHGMEVSTALFWGRKEKILSFILQLWCLSELGWGWENTSCRQLRVFTSLKTPTQRTQQVDEPALFGQG